MSDLVGWLLAQIDADEQAARWCAAGYGARWHVKEIGQDMIEDETGSEVVHYDGLRTLSDAAHIARHDPARVLAECKAKRAIVDLHTGPQYGRERAHLCQDSMTYDDECETLRALAQVYAGNEGWREEWATP